MSAIGEEEEGEERGVSGRKGIGEGVRPRGREEIICRTKCTSPKITQ